MFMFNDILLELYPHIDPEKVELMNWLMIAYVNRCLVSWKSSGPNLKSQKRKSF
jgi:hypothetical protein